ncbi:MAG: tRNA pseudouridine(38-40) synthase TruA [Leptospira sp.]|nr:tRNA pseudouridine(38-40) synthase TruA [Leptospira sp.]
MPGNALLLEYDGSFFHGFQRQKSLNSVQGSLEKAIQTILQEKIIIHPAGRTDTGVHARGMIVGFHTEKKIENYHRFIMGINSMTGGKVAVIAAREMNEKFHARFSCSGREYEYHILNSVYPHPLLEKRVYWVKKPVSLDIIRNELNFLKGKMDFSSFSKKTALLNKSPQRQITDVEIIESPELAGLIKIRVKGTGFLHNMVRIIVGTLIDIGRGKIKDRNILNILNEKDRRKAGVTLPPYGLYFIRAYYENFPEIAELYKSSANLVKS